MKGHTFVRAVFLAAVILGAAALGPRLAGDVLTSADHASSVREIHLVVKDMTFYIEGEDSPNPTLHARPGERIRLVLRNTDSGMSHDFTIRSWNVNTRLLKGKAQDSIEFTVPDTRGSHVYNCTPHWEMMNGFITVE